MAHNIARINGKDSMAYVGVAPWHKLGTYLGDQHVTSAEIAAAAGLDYEVALQPVYTINPVQTITQMVTVPGKHAVVRTDTGAVLGVVSERWEPVQNRDSFKFADALIGLGMLWETAGALGQGERMWALAKMPGDDIIIGGDQVKRYLMFANGHDGTLAFTVQQTAVRVVCENTLQMALNAGAQQQAYRLIHKRGINADLNPEDAAEIIGVSDQYFARMQEIGDRLAEQKITMKDLTAFVEELFPLPALSAPRGYMALPAPKADSYIISTRLTNIRSKVISLCLNGKGNDRAAIAGTKWAALNGVVEYVDHGYGREDTRASSVMFGSGKQIKQRALNLLTA